MRSSLEIEFTPFTHQDFPIYKKWSEFNHVKNTWFLDGYESREAVLSKIEEGGYDFPFIIQIEGKKVGFIQYCDLYAYKTQCKDPKGVFTDEEKGTYCMDLFIGEDTYLNKGYGTKIVKAFSEMILKTPGAKKVLIDPASSNKRAIKCYEKAGFYKLKDTHDGVEDVTILSKTKEDLIKIHTDKPDDFIPRTEVVGCYIKNENDFLFLKKAKGGSQEDTWGVAGGKIAEGESALDAVIREIFEETGILLTADKVRLEKTLYIDNPYFGKYFLHLFYYQCEKRPEVKLSKEHVDYRWVTLEKAKMLDLLHGGLKSLSLFEATL